MSKEGKIVFCTGGGCPAGKSTAKEIQEEQNLPTTKIPVRPFILFSFYFLFFLYFLLSLYYNILIAIILHAR